MQSNNLLFLGLVLFELCKVVGHLFNIFGPDWKFWVVSPDIHSPGRMTPTVFGDLTVYATLTMGFLSLSKMFQQLMDECHKIKFNSEIYCS